MFVAALDPRIDEINVLLSRLGRSSRWLAEKIGRSHTSVLDWVDDKRPTHRLPKQREILDNMLVVLRRELAVPNAQVQTYGKPLRLLPVYGSLTCGPPDTYEAVIDYEEIADWGGTFTRWGWKVKGDSMEPILRTDDIAVIENSKYETGDVVQAYNLDEMQATLKALRGEGEFAQFWSFNETGNPPFSAKGWIVAGVCVGRIRYGRFGIRQVTEFKSGLSWAMRNEDA